MTLWLIFALMTAAAIFVVVWPIARRKVVVSGSDVAVYRDQLEEIERDRAAGLIGAAEAEAARVEVSRRLLAASDGRDVAQPKPARNWVRRTVAVAVLIALPAGAGAVYLTLGSPTLPGEPLVSRAVAERTPAAVLARIAQIENYVEQNPEDGKTWEALANVYMRLNRYDDAVKASRNALRLLGNSAERQGNLGIALTAAANGMITAEAKEAFDRAVALNPGDAASNYFIGLAAEQDGRREDAARIWTELATSVAPDAPIAQLIRRSLARLGVEAPAVSAAPGPSTQDMEAAAAMDPKARSEMIRGMVSRLADRLKTEGNDIDGWLRLVRAYMVLGDREKALAAATDARRALASDPENVRRIDDLVKGLGLEG
jgi:cytochrome c-type biogenesis protein CcmH